jgi:hypothetical protein
MFSNPNKYRHLVEKLNYLTIIRPDITFAVKAVSQILEAQSVPPKDVAIQIVQYLKKAPGRGILFKKNDHLKVEVYTDANRQDQLQIEDLPWGTAPFGRKSCDMEK